MKGKRGGEEERVRVTVLQGVVVCYMVLYGVTVCRILGYSVLHGETGCGSVL